MKVRDHEGGFGSGHEGRGRERKVLSDSGGITALSLRWVGRKRSQGHPGEIDGKEDRGITPVEVEEAKAKQKEEKERRVHERCTARRRTEEKSAALGTTRIRDAGINVAGCTCVRYALDSIRHMHAKEKTRRIPPVEVPQLKRSEEVFPRGISSLRGAKRR